MPATEGEGGAAARGVRAAAEHKMMMMWKDMCISLMGCARWIGAGAGTSLEGALAIPSDGSADANEAVSGSLRCSSSSHGRPETCVDGDARSQNTHGTQPSSHPPFFFLSFRAHAEGDVHGWGEAELGFEAASREGYPLARIELARVHTRTIFLWPCVLVLVS